MRRFSPVPSSCPGAGYDRCNLAVPRSASDRRTSPRHRRKACRPYPPGAWYRTSCAVRPVNSPPISCTAVKIPDASRSRKAISSPVARPCPSSTCGALMPTIRLVLPFRLVGQRAQGQQKIVTVLGDFDTQKRPWNQKHSCHSRSENWPAEFRAAPDPIIPRRNSLLQFGPHLFQQLFRVDIGRRQQQKRVQVA